MSKEEAMRRASLRFVGIIAVAALALAVTSWSALAAVNVKSLPTATFSGASVTLTGGNFSGLGSVPAIATLTVDGSATYTCTNPQGHASPGQNPVPAQTGTQNQDLGNADHKGRGTITDMTASVTGVVPTPSAQTVGCGGQGSTQWSVTLNTLTAESAHLVITQGGSVIFCRDYTLGGSATGTAC
jgi:hypothetical protein